MMTMDLQVVTVENTAAVSVVNHFSFSERLIFDWLKFNADKSAETVKTYNKALKNFFSFLKANSITAPCRDDVIRYRDELRATKSVGTAKLYLTAVKIFSRWLASTGSYPNFADGVKAPKRDEADETHTREALTLDEAKQVLNSFSGTSEKTLRDKLIMRLMLNCGLRSVEVVRLDSTDIERRHGKIFLKVWGKGRSGKTARVEISKTIYDMILDYLNTRGAKCKTGEPMFTSTSNRNRGQRLQTQTVSRLAKKIFRSVGIDSPTVTCHSCRHTAATVMLLNGVDISKVQKILRHKSATTTEVYRHDITAANNDGVAILSGLLDY